MGKLKVAVERTKDTSRRLKGGSIDKKKDKNVFSKKIASINGSSAKNGEKKILLKRIADITESPRRAASIKKGSRPDKSLKAKIEIGEDDDDDSSVDINEGISIAEIFSGAEDEDEAIMSDDGEAVPDILGASLADETDDSDEDFDADEKENDAEVKESQGVKMFKGTKKMIESLKNDKNGDDDSEDDSDDNSEDDGDGDSDDDDDDQDKSALGLSALLGDSIKDDSGDEDFVGSESSCDDDDDDDDDEDDDEDEEDDDEDDEDDNDKTDANESLQGLADLLGNSLADDTDDDDYTMEDDDDEDDEDQEDKDSAKNSSAGDKKSTGDSNMNTTRKEMIENDKRTIYIGNVSKDTKLERLLKEFKKFGPIDTIRVRGIIPENPKVPLRVAAIKKRYHPKSTTLCVYIVYKNEESVAKSLVMNGKTFDGNYLRVDSSENSPGKNVDRMKCVFLGNLPFDVQDNEVWEAFKSCGPIESVRIVRDRNTAVGYGYGYINFESADGATLAHDLNGTKIKDRSVRVSAIVSDAKKKPHVPKESKKRHQSDSNEERRKKQKTENSESIVELATRNSKNAERRKENKNKNRSQGETQRKKKDSSSPKVAKKDKKFQGQTADAKKKTNRDKSSKKKKQMAAMLLAKPKKPASN